MNADMDQFRFSSFYENSDIFVVSVMRDLTHASNEEWESHLSCRIKHWVTLLKITQREAPIAILVWTQLDRASEDKILMKKMQSEHGFRFF